jgi:hypothetical protein
LKAVTIVNTVTQTVPYTVTGETVLFSAQANTQVVLSNRGDLTYADWQGAGALTDGPYDGRYAELGSFDWPSGVKFNFLEGEIIFLAWSGSGSIELYFESPPAEQNILSS